jgi:diguanylate cyclase (GGDEF)-like protein/PAS domain S-box-containing protein
MRYLITESDRAAWQIVAQGFPNFTFSQDIRNNAAQVDRDLLYLKRAHTGNTGVEAVMNSVPTFQRELALVQQLIAKRKLSQAQIEVLVGVDGTAQLIQHTIEGLARAFSSRAITANARLFTGTLIALGASALLVALLASAFAFGRRRAIAAQRAALAHSERRFRAMVQKASEVVVLTDAERRITYVTDAVVGLLGLSAEELIGRELETVLPAGERPRALQMFERTVRTGEGTGPSEWTLVRADGSVGFIEVRSTNLLHDPDVAGIALTVRDITRRREMEAQLRHQALHDPLTGLPNRTLFEDRVSQALQRAGRHRRSISVMYLDIDGFKAINDSMGHGAGDELLCTIAGRIDECLRGVDAAARLGGDEFACLVESLGDRDDALVIARRLAGGLARPAMVQGRSITVRASIGVAHASGVSISAEQLIRNADLAMYKAKAEGRGEIGVFDENLLVAARRRLDLREDLRLAIDRGELSLAYQPLVRLDSRILVGTEALLRWHHPQSGFIAPDQFIPIAEDTGLIVSLGRWVLDRALADLAGWSTLAPRMSLNVNVAPRELAEPDYVQAVSEALARHRIDPARVTLELTESDFLDVGETLQRLHALAQLGVKLAIDDFGTGQSSLARLQRLPVAQVKLDRSFLAVIDDNSQHATLVRSMIELGQALGMQMVAEGIERDTQLHILQDAARPLDSEAPDALGQGYLFARPQAAEAITALLTSPAPAAA